MELRAFEKLAYRKYSLGMKQRLGIAAALLNDPEIVMLDEPTNGLDPSGVIEIRQLIQRLSALGKTVFLSSHILSEVQQVCNRVAFLRKGNLVKQGNVKDLLSEKEQIEVRMGQEDQTQNAFGVLQRAQEYEAHWISDIKIEKNKQNLSILTLDAPAAHSADVNMLLAQHSLFAAEIHPREGTLEEIFLEVVGTPTPGQGPLAGSSIGGTLVTAYTSTAEGKGGTR